MSNIDCPASQFLCLLGGISAKTGVHLPLILGETILIAELVGGDVTEARRYHTEEKLTNENEGDFNKRIPKV